MKGTDGSAVLQAEAYFADTCLMIRNARTDKTVEQTRHHVSVNVCEVPDFAAFLEHLAPKLDGARLLVAFGDSTTANVHNWPYRFAKNSAAEQTVVVNLADWARSSEMHVPVLEMFLEFLRRCNPSRRTAVLMLGLRDIHDRLTNYVNFTEGGQALFSEGEERLRDHRHGAEIGRLAARFPADWTDTRRWIARRILAGVKVMERLCLDADMPFFALLEPSSFSDCSPGYLAALQQAYRADVLEGEAFDAWLQRRHFSRDPSQFGPRDHRPFLDDLRAQWHAQASKATSGHYVDLSALFREEPGCCFQGSFDAVHYNPSGSELIAGAIARLLHGTASA